MNFTALQTSSRKEEPAERAKMGCYDFGFATRYPTMSKPFLETFCGSYAYAAPEILQAEKYDGKVADIWSLGIILFAMLNGRLPFSDRDIPTLVEQTKGKLRFSTRVKISAECQDLVKRILTSNQRKRITIPEIFRHEWMLHQDSDESLDLTLSRGIPDGKSEKFTSAKTEHSENVKMFQKPQRVAETKGGSFGNQLKGLNKGKWFQNNSISSAMATLLSEQIQQSNNPLVEKDVNIGNCKNAEPKGKLTLCAVTQMAWCSLQQKKTVVAPSIQEQTFAAVKSCDPPPASTIGKIEYRYQKDAAYKKKTKPFEKKKDLQKDWTTMKVDALSPQTVSKCKEPKFPMTNFNANERTHNPGWSEKTQSESPSLNLPAVAKDGGKNSILSSNQGTVRRKSICQPTFREARTKRNDMTNLPNTRWRAFANEIVNLRGNWPKTSTRRKNSRDQKKLALTYYTFSGREVHHRD